MSGASSSIRKQEFANFIVELMAGWAPVQARRMFGGFGVYRDGLMFAILIEDTLYLKVDDESEPLFAQRGLARFSYESKGRTASLRYCEAPPEAYDEPAHMATWARLAYDCAVRQQNRKKPASRARKSVRLDTPVTPEAQAAGVVGSSVSMMRNLGPKSQEMLAKVGIVHDEDLRRLGAVVAYARTKAVCPQASLNLLWALEGALTDRDWKVVADTERASLLMALEDVRRHML
ncbi:MAG: TfoX/Sxy family DNA transformation protein [Aquabacterium sp.]|uniref:TfoX/Sxy family DNA transformation protein n=1 Tax=Aquabacterium sp. TaxID=1872578 RepID=UPI0025BC52C7|nr:TfoX/Sxy family DNA transformation protein [Aquabacterium sp.]MBI5925600.1 TfoX/Sxy family DNA transformation protein [Aquabacterium sp.]